MIRTLPQSPPSLVELTAHVIAKDAKMFPIHALCVLPHELKELVCQKRMTKR